MVWDFMFYLPPGWEGRAERRRRLLGEIGQKGEPQQVQNGGLQPVLRGCTIRHRSTRRKRIGDWICNTADRMVAKPPWVRAHKRPCFAARKHQAAACARRAEDAVADCGCESGARALSVAAALEAVARGGHWRRLRRGMLVPRVPVFSSRWLFAAPARVREGGPRGWRQRRGRVGGRRDAVGPGVGTNDFRTQGIQGLCFAAAAAGVPFSAYMQHLLHGGHPAIWAVQGGGFDGVASRALQPAALGRWRPRLRPADVAASRVQLRQQPGRPEAGARGAARERECRKAASVTGEAVALARGADARALLAACLRRFCVAWLCAGLCRRAPSVLRLIHGLLMQEQGLWFCAGPRRRRAPSAVQAGTLARAEPKVHRYLPVLQRKAGCKRESQDTGS